MSLIYANPEEIIHDSFNIFCPGRAAGHSPGELSAEEPAATGGEQCPQREDLQLGEVQTLMCTQ